MISQMVLVTEEKEGGDCFRPIRSTNGKAMSGLPSKDVGKTSASLGTSCGLR